MYTDKLAIYTPVMSKRLVEIDDALLAHAREAAGTATIKATVEAGLRQLVNTDLTARHIRRLRQPRALDPAMIDQARSPRVADRG